MNQQQTKRTFSLFTYLITGAALLSGILVGYMIGQRDATNIKTATRTVHVLVSDGISTRNWNNVTLEEGQSVADLIDKIASIEQLPITWNGNGKDRTLTSFINATEGFQWTYFINNAQPGQPIGRFIPKHGDVIVLVGVKQ